MSGRSVRAGAALAAAAVLLSTPDAARAGGPGGGGDLEWIRIACFSGAIDRVSVDGGLIEVDGHVDCGQSLPGSAAFMYALYRDKQAVAYGSTVSIYGAVAPSPRSIRKDLPAGMFGLCLVTDYTVRVACVTVSPARGGMVTVADLPTGDPLVDQPVVVVGYGGWTDPACATCW